MWGQQGLFKKYPFPLLYFHLTLSSQLYQYQIYFKVHYHIYYLMPRQNNPFLFSSSIKPSSPQLAKMSDDLCEHDQMQDNKSAEAQVIECLNRCKNKGNKLAQWTLEQEKVLFELHEKVGNKWSKLAQHFLARSDNCVKNHFYSRFRMSLRHLNKYLEGESLKKRCVKMNILSKIMSTCEQRFNQSTDYTSQFIEFANRLKNQIIYYLYYNQQDIFIKHQAQNNLRQNFNKRGLYDKNQVIQMVEDINQFNHRFKARRDILKQQKERKQYRKKEPILQQQEQQFVGGWFSGVQQMKVVESEQSVNVWLAVLKEGNSFKDLKIIEQAEYVCNNVAIIVNEPFDESSHSPLHLWDKLI